MEEQMKLFTGANQFIGFYHVKNQEEIASSIDFQNANCFLYRVLLLSSFYQENPYIYFLQENPYIFFFIEI